MCNYKFLNIIFFEIKLEVTLLTLIISVKTVI